MENDDKLLQVYWLGQILSVPERSEGTEVMKTAIRAAIVFWRRKDFGGAE